MPRPAALPDALAELRRRVDGEVRDDRVSRILYSTDASIYQVEPYAVLLPRTTDDLHAAVEVAAAYELPLLARTSGSSLAGQAVNEALVVDCSRHLDGVLEVDPDRRRVRVEPGVVLDRLNDHLRPHGLMFGPDPASSERAAMGGIVANNSTGAHSILHGMTADHVVEAKVVLSDGSSVRLAPLTPEEVRRAGRRPGLEGEIYQGIFELVADEANRSVIRAGTPRHWRRCGGYNLDRLIPDGGSFRLSADERFNLARLVCGSEGTLAVMTDVTLGLVPVPRRTALALVHFDGLHQALSAVPLMLEAEPSAIELLDHLGLTLCRGVPAYSRLLDTFLEGDPDCLLITEFQGGGRAELEAAVDRLESLLRRGRAGATAVVRAFDPARQRDVWTVRKVGLGLMMSVKGDHKPIPFIEDAAVPVEHLADYVGEIERFCGERGSRLACYAHASAGCIHLRPLIDTKQAREVAKLPEILSFAVELLQGYGGSLSSEHGDGRARSWVNERFFGPELFALYRQVKAIFDPRDLLNPGNLVGAPAMTQNLRYGEAYRVRLPPPRVDFSADLGFDRAIEMCNGAGVCRKLDAGTMCPSFMATREEEHSTRGRANLLRAALDGRLPAAEITGRRLYEAMDLCVECKACKAECPSSVDMAKIKLQFLAGYHDAHGTPLRARLFAHTPALGRWLAGPAAMAANALLAAPPAKALLDSVLGIDRRRDLPRFARRSAPAILGSRPNGGGRGEPATLFLDCFNAYQTPAVGVAAHAALTAAGYAVATVSGRCCGRPMISKGLVDDARAAARALVERLAPIAARGEPIVGLEPSCLLSLRDEYLYLLPGDERAVAVAERALTFEEALAGRVAAERVVSVAAAGQAKVLLHDHCHQKALVGSDPSRRVLEAAGHEVEVLDAGCCGMAGAFGYEREHYEISLAMAERRLLPAVRAAADGTLIVANGTSCRQQILHGCGRRALHPAEVLSPAAGSRGVDRPSILPG
jgi:FAD/FMN-containing dehydrogenase/Fe-S oxidoreductase